MSPFWLLSLAAATAQAARSSAGCGTSPSHPIGESYSDSFITSDGDTRTYRVFVPESYDDTVPVPLVLSLHGWGGTSLEDSCDSGLTAVAKNTSAFMVAHLQGMQDYPKGNPSNWGSWHLNGTCQNNGVSCDTRQSPDQYCYASNDDCQDCDWTSCTNDVAYISALLDHFEAQFCVDLNRIYVTGQSNGGMMTYQLGASLSHRLAAIAPISGSMPWKKVVAPENPIPVFAVTGTRDGTVPGNGTTAGRTTDGTWYYNSMDHLAGLWATAQGGDGIETRYFTMYDGFDDLWCKSAHSNIDHVLCSWNGRHNYFSGKAEKYVFQCNPENLEETYYRNGFLVWEFFSRHARS